MGTEYFLHLLLSIIISANINCLSVLCLNFDTHFPEVCTMIRIYFNLRLISAIFVFNCVISSICLSVYLGSGTRCLWDTLWIRGRIFSLIFIKFWACSKIFYPSITRAVANPEYSKGKWLFQKFAQNFSKCFYEEVMQI